MAPTALVTGAGGFVGANLVRRLRDAGQTVHAAIRPGAAPWRLAGLDDVAPVELDAGDAGAVHAAVERLRPERVFHLAAHGGYSWQTDVTEMVRVNVGGTAALAEACARNGARVLVHAGSSSEYGYQDHAPSEGELPEPNSPYAVTKLAATLYCGQVAREAGLPAVTLRLYSAYGPWEEPGRLMPTLAALGLEGRLPPLVEPSTARDFVHVDDVVDALLVAAERAPVGGAVYNVGSGVQTSLGELVDLARRVFGVRAEPRWGATPARSWDTDVWVADPTRIRDELGWTPRRDLEAGLLSLGDWLRRRPELLDRYLEASPPPLP